MQAKLDSIAAMIQKADDDAKGLPPVHSWTPDLSGSIDIRICADGRWFHEGGEIKRLPLVKLFSSILRRENDDYFLVTPVEKWQIKVEDAPFFAGAVEKIVDAGVDKLVFTLNIGSSVIANAQHPLRVVMEPSSGEPRPYLRVRDNLDALIGRNAFYQLVEWASVSEQRVDELVLSSSGAEFSLGQV